MPKLLPVEPGDEITADLFNALVAAANRLDLNTGPSGGLVLSDGPNGYTLDAYADAPIWGKTTGGVSGGTYPFTEQFPATGGTWTAGTMTDVAYEVNGNASVPTGTYVQLWRDSVGSWLFRSDSC